jgi:hypothetical protein
MNPAAGFRKAEVRRKSGGSQAEVRRKSGGSLAAAAGRLAHGLQFARAATAQTVRASGVALRLAGRSTHQGTDIHFEGRFAARASNLHSPISTQRGRAVNCPIVPFRRQEKAIAYPSCWVMVAPGRPVSDPMKKPT